MKVGFIITARLKSTRLPRKLLLKIQGESVIGHMIERLKISPYLDEIIVATSKNPEDDELGLIAAEKGVKCFRGHEKNVVQRLYMAAKEYTLDYIINTTGDCPLVAYDYIRDVIDLYDTTEADLITTSDLPHGMFFYGIKPEALNKILATLPRDAETSGWGIYFFDSGGFMVEKVSFPDELNRKDLRLTLDYPEDFEMLTRLYEGLGKKVWSKPTRDIIHFLDAHPDIPRINSFCEERYLKRFEEEYHYNPKLLEK